MRTGPKIVVDEGRINERILDKLSLKDYLAKIEAPRRKIPIRLCSPNMKRVFLRFFDSMQVNLYFISVFARTHLPEHEVAAVEDVILKHMTDVSAEVDHAIAGAHALFDANGITSPAEYDAKPLEIQVRVISKFGRRYLELIAQVDTLLPLLETLSIDDVITQGELRLQKETINKAVRQVAGAARLYAARLRARITQLAAAEATAERDRQRSKRAEPSAVITASDALPAPESSSNQVVPIAPRRARGTLAARDIPTTDILEPTPLNGSS